MLFFLSVTSAWADEEQDSLQGKDMRMVSVKATHAPRLKSKIENTEMVGKAELHRAACCNLGESFTTNPSVDVSYSDAATGAQQIKLLGLSGTYVQMLTENVPNLRGASIPYSLGYVPGPWLQSIQVSKGASSVKNGYESITGQINTEFLKPQSIEGVRANLYLDSDLKFEANADASVHLGDHLSTALLLHYEDRQSTHDSNEDGFMDMPKIRQYNVMNKWAYSSEHYVSHLSLRLLRDDRKSGQAGHAVHLLPGTDPYRIRVTTDRYEGQWKNGFVLNDEHNTSMALILHGSWHDADNAFGRTLYDVTQKNGYAQLLFETDLGQHHNLSTGISVNHDYYREHLISTAFSLPQRGRAETTSGVYAQYTYRLGDRLSVMPGLRWDYSGVYGGFFTPRLHLRYSPIEILTLRASAGKGYRSAHALAENTPMLASGRTFYFEDNLKQEEAWNYGISGGLHLPVAGKTLELNAEYYYTHFLNQMVANVDGARGAHTVSFENLHGKSYSHTFQVDATYPFFQGFDATAAIRYNDARTTYDGILRQRPLTSKYKGLLTLSYKTPLELWQFDVTGQVNGHGERYDQSRYPTYFQLQAQVTREFPRFSLYVGGENLTNYRMKNPVIGADNPWSAAFDATQTWGPVDGAMAYVGMRFKLEKL